MEKYLYTCQYCGKEYKPNRRKKQKYCSDSCRVRAFTIKKTRGLSLPQKENEKKDAVKIEKMSWAGVGNAAAGALAVNIAANIFTSEENKPATKKDLNLLKNSLNLRYHRILNMQNDIYGSLPYFDIETKTVVYLKSENHGRTNR